MNKNNYNNYYLYAVIITSLIVLLLFWFSLFDSFFVYFSLQFLICAIIFLGINLYFLFAKSKKTIPLLNWYEHFIHSHQNEFEEYKNQANEAVKKFITIKVIVLQIYILSMIILLCTFFIQLEFAYDIAEILMLALKFYGFIILEAIAYTFVNLIMHKKYYFCYLDPKNNNKVYLYMTYLLLQIKNVDRIYINYNDFINTSASLTRLMYFNESYEFLTIWKSNLKKMNPLFSFVYIEHCLFDFVMTKKDADVIAAYNDYQINLKKYKKYAKHKNVQKCTHYVEILFAFYNQDYQKVIELSKESDKYFSKDEYRDSYDYILYTSYMHIDKDKAIEFYNPNNLFFQKENV